MAAYKVWRVPLIPFRALEVGGAEVGPLPDGSFPSDDEFMRNDKGKLEVFYKAVSPGHIAYTEQGDYESLSDEEKANSTYSPFPSFYAEHTRFEFETLDGEKFTGVEEYNPSEGKKSARRSGGASASDNKGSTKQPSNSNQ